MLLHIVVVVRGQYQVVVVVISSSSFHPYDALLVTLGDEFSSVTIH